jgi:acetyl/propionyl-CoA carboxylase alpha subunit
LQYTYRVAEDEYTVEVQRGPDGWSVTVGENERAEFTAEPLGDGHWLLRSEGRQIHAFTASRGDQRFVFCGGHVTCLRLPDPDAGGQETSAGGGPHIVAAMPGKVVKILVEVDVAVTAGDPVIVMESMKMETEVAAPVDGRIAIVHVAEGQTVAQNDPLIDVEPHTGT